MSHSFRITLPASETARKHFRKKDFAILLALGLAGRKVRAMKMYHLFIMWLLGALLSLAVLAAIAYVAIHFLKKVW